LDIRDALKPFKAAVEAGETAALQNCSLRAHIRLASLPFQRGLALSAHGLRRRWNMVALATEADDTDTFMPRFAELLRAHGPGAEA
jgi:hypothetical protein